MKRREINWSLAKHQPDYRPLWSIRSDVELTFTRKGIEVFGFYDSVVGIGDTILIPWPEIDAMRQKVMGKVKVEGE